MKKLFVFLLLVFATTVPQAAPRPATTVDDCAIMGLNARMWKAVNQSHNPPISLVNVIYLDYSAMVAKKEMAPERAFKLMGLLLVAKEVVDSTPNATPEELEKKAMMRCISLFGKTA